MDKKNQRYSNVHKASEANIKKIVDTLEEQILIWLPTSFITNNT